MISGKGRGMIFRQLGYKNVPSGTFLLSTVLGLTCWTCSTNITYRGRYYQHNI